MTMFIKMEPPLDFGRPRSEWGLGGGVMPPRQG